MRRERKKRTISAYLPYLILWFLRLWRGEDMGHSVLICLSEHRAVKGAAEGVCPEQSAVLRKLQDVRCACSVRRTVRHDQLPWRSVVKSPPACAGGTVPSLIQEGPTCSAREPLLLKPTCSGACALRQEKPAQVEKARTRQRRPSAIRMINRCS